MGTTKEFEEGEKINAVVNPKRGTFIDKILPSTPRRVVREKVYDKNVDEGFGFGKGGGRFTPRYKFAEEPKKGTIGYVLQYGKRADRRRALQLVRKRMKLKYRFENKFGRMSIFQRAWLASKKVSIPRTVEEWKPSVFR